MAIIGYGQVHMANLCVAMLLSALTACASSTAKFSRTIPCSTTFTCMDPQKFSAITNGITHRRWLFEANPGADLAH